MILGLLIVPTLVLVGAVGAAICAALGWPVHGTEMLLAGIAILLASKAAMIPLILTRGRSQYAVSQAGLVGTMIHLMFSTGAAGILMLKQKMGMPFVYWLFAFYFASLIVLVMTFVQAVNKAPVARPAQS